MVRPLLESCSLQTLAQIESLDPILGGALISSSEFKCIDTECRPLSFIYRYSSTTLEVRDIIQTESVYASLTIQDLPTKERHQVGFNTLITPLQWYIFVKLTQPDSLLSNTLYMVYSETPCAYSLLLAIVKRHCPSCSFLIHGIYDAAL
jgi:hypothetical protein